METLKEEIINKLEKLNDKIIDKLSLQKEEDKKITIQDVNLLLWVAKTISIIVNIIKEKQNDLL